MRKIILLASLLGLSFILAACGTSGEQKPSKDSQKSEKYTYEYYEVLNNGSEDTPNVEIKYKDKNGKSHLQKTDLEHVYEHILNDGNKSLI